MNTFLAFAHSHSDSVLPLRIVFGICLALVIFAGIYILRYKRSFFQRDPDVAADHYGARNLRLWQVILVWILAIDLLVTILWRL